MKMFSSRLKLAADHTHKSEVSLFNKKLSTYNNGDHI